jgi:hypothetical protein
MTELVRAGSAVDGDYRLLSEVQRDIIDASPAMSQEWEDATKAEAKSRAALRAAGGSVSRHTGNAEVAPDGGTSLEGEVNSAMARRDKLLLSADAKIRGGLIDGLLTPLTIKRDQVFRIVGHDWAREIDHQQIHSGRLYVEDQHRTISFSFQEVDKFLHRSKSHEKASTVARCKAWLKEELDADKEGRIAKDEYLKRAQEKFGILKKTFINNVWKEVAPPKNRRGGRKPRAARS